MDEDVLLLCVELTCEMGSTCKARHLPTLHIPLADNNFVVTVVFMVTICLLPRTPTHSPHTHHSLSTLTHSHSLPTHSHSLTSVSLLPLTPHTLTTVSLLSLTPTHSPHTHYTHHSLDQLHSLMAYLVDDSWDIHNILLPHLLQSLVYCDECPRPTYSSTAGGGIHSGNC